MLLNLRTGSTSDLDLEEEVEYFAAEIYDTWKYEEENQKALVRGWKNRTRTLKSCSTIGALKSV